MYKRVQEDQVFYIDENQQLAVYDQEEGEDDIKITSHFYLSGQRIASVVQLGFKSQYDQYDARQVFWYHSDHLGTASLITDRDGKPYERIEYTPYGEVWNEFSIDKREGFNFIDSGFTSKPLDKETGLYNFPQRYYDSQNVKWLTLDPIGPMLMNLMEMGKDGRMVPKRAYSQTEGLNWYSYCDNNPILYHDPDGRIKINPNEYYKLLFQYSDIGKFFSYDKKTRKDILRSTRTYLFDVGIECTEAVALTADSVVLVAILAKNPVVAGVADVVGDCADGATAALQLAKLINNPSGYTLDRFFRQLGKIGAGLAYKIVVNKYVTIGLKAGGETLDLQVKLKDVIFNKIGLQTDVQGKIVEFMMDNYSSDLGKEAGLNTREAAEKLSNEIWNKISDLRESYKEQKKAGNIE